MGTVLSFQDLVVWQKSHQFVLEIYSLTKIFPKDELYALTNQIRRASVSIPANIAEGFTKKTLANKINFLSHSKGSLEEVKYYLILVKDLNYISLNDFEKLTQHAEEVSKLINGYAKSIKNYHENNPNNKPTTNQLNN
ncbi:MAG: four helix bundle protein [Chryseobacterium sp.]|uniref:four helix bundle protein n=1 Tax=Epilithonimonas caeni TaxID=365343 RepID=UPI0003FD749B|nr:four helix bundle protein [Epilithonimonas caeni]MPS73400.1 four helix bundle protein [Chryseobacterium sp.]